MPRESDPENSASEPDLNTSVNVDGIAAETARLSTISGLPPSSLKRLSDRISRGIASLA
jgi:hypothetical protein